MALGWALFDERIGLGLRLFPEIIGIALIGAGTVGLAHATSQTESWDAQQPQHTTTERH